MLCMTSHEIKIIVCGSSRMKPEVDSWAAPEKVHAQVEQAAAEEALSRVYKPPPWTAGLTDRHQGKVSGLRHILLSCKTTHISA